MLLKLNVIYFKIFAARNKSYFVIEIIKENVLNFRAKTCYEITAKCFENIPYRTSTPNYSIKQNMFLSNSIDNHIVV